MTIIAVQDWATRKSYLKLSPKKAWKCSPTLCSSWSLYGDCIKRPPVICDLFIKVPWRVTYNSLDCTLFTHVPYHFTPVSFCPLERNCWMINTIYPCPVSFCPLDWTHGVGLLCFNRNFRANVPFHTNKKPCTTKAYDRRASGDCGTSGYKIWANKPTDVHEITFPRMYSISWFHEKWAPWK